MRDTKANAAPSDERPAGHWGVRDTNARMLDDKGEPMPRTHEPVRGKTYQLHFDRETFMPEEHARKFLRDPAFLVTDEIGEPVASLNVEALKRTNPTGLLPTNMVIASLEELTQTALMTRCSQRPRAPKFNGDTTRETMIRFLQDEFHRDQTGEDPTTSSIYEDTGAGVDLDDWEPPRQPMPAAPVRSSERLLEGA